MNVLIVDDDSTVRNVLSEILSYIGGYDTDTAVDGLEGLEKIRNNYYDIIFVDLSMPRLSGMDLLRETRKIAPYLPVVVITGFSTIDNAINAMREGAKDFIAKPFHISTVTAVADRIICEKNIFSKIAQHSDHKTSIEILNAELSKKLQEMSIFQSISTELDGLDDNNETYERIVEMASRLLIVKEVSFGIIENGVLRIKRAVGAREKAFSIAGTIYENVVKTKQHHIAIFGESNPHTGIPLASPFLAIPFTINNEVFGILSLSDKADGSIFTDEDVALAVTFAKKAAQRIENNALYEVFYNNVINTLKSLITSIEAKDAYTKNHSERVTRYALQIADLMAIDDEEKDALKFGGYLHDIGKIGVKDTVLLKPGRLTDEEMTEIRQHPVIGDNIIRPLNFFLNEQTLILCHHENVDGTGYPNGLKGNQIPLTARILAVADSYDAMTSSRPYRKPKTHDFAVQELIRCSNTQFDGEVVQAFLQTPTGRGGEQYGF